MIKPWILCLTFVHLISISTSVDISCSYVYYTFTVVGYTYHCDVRYDPNIISEESAVVNQARGTHESHKADDDVTGFYSSGKKIEVFPRGLENVFKNLKLIVINYGRLTDIHQADLQPFDKLENLNLAYNNIKVIEEGLFDFNPELAYISFSNNKIHQVHPKVFGHLSKLSFLALETNVCIDMRVDNSISDVKELIKKVKVACCDATSNGGSDFTNDFNNLNAQILSTGAVAVEKLENLEKALNATDESLQTFKSEVLAVLQTILKKFEENSACFKASQAVDHKMTSIEVGLSDLQSQEAVDALSDSETLQL